MTHNFKDLACGGDACDGNADASDAWYVGILDCVFFLPEFWLEDLEFWLFLDIWSKQFNITNVNHIWLIIIQTSGFVI